LRRNEEQRQGAVQLASLSRSFDRIGLIYLHFRASE